jgi:hypothetical protein
MSAEGLDGSSVGKLPQFDGAIVASGGKGATVGVNCDRADEESMLAFSAYPVTRWQVPECNCAIPTAANQGFTPKSSKTASTLR